MDGALPLAARSIEPEDWTISVCTDEPAWVIVSQLADPEWTATWVGLDGQGEQPSAIVPTFRKGREPGGWQRVLVPGRGCWTLRLQYQPDDLVEGMAVSALAWISWIVAALVTGLKALVGRSVPNRDHLEAPAVWASASRIPEPRSPGGGTSVRPKPDLRGTDVTTKIGVAIVGASGYAARELIAILLNHPEVRITAATSRQDEAPRLEALHPSLARSHQPGLRAVRRRPDRRPRIVCVPGPAAHRQHGGRSCPPPARRAGHRL